MTFIKSSLMIGIILILCFFMEAKGEVNLYLSRVNYLPGDLWRASVEIKDFEYDGPLDVYFLLMNPKGDIYTLPQNTSGINPAFEGLTIPPGYNLSRTVIWERTCPNNVVPIHDFGNYVFAFALTKSGTFDIVGNIAFKKALYEKPKRYGEWWYLYPNNDFNTLAVDKYDRIWCSSEETGLFCIEGDDIRY
ncbi:hypothetical protein KKB18_13215, partial [bacterium]|nr:hypothetical protein [bacterium]